MLGPMRTVPSSPNAHRALHLVHHLQRQFVSRLEQAQRSIQLEQPFTRWSWERDGGRHGGGERMSTGDSRAFDRASINTSCVHYDDDPDRALSSATALSAIVHPRNPHAPSIHLHVSYTELRGEPGTWRVMADLNPSIPYDRDRDRFAHDVEAVTGDTFAHATAQGDRYFAIPSLGRTRGVFHYYLEGYRTLDAEADETSALVTAEAAIASYGRIIESRMATPVTPEDQQKQREYHTLYLFQVLTLDRGTTSGLLVHDQNDVGILGSLPSTIDPALLSSWKEGLLPLQKVLVDEVVSCLHGETALVTDDVKRLLAKVIRGFYRAHPEAVHLQARGDVVPPTVWNHVGRR